jgi:Holliday junction resolvase
MSYKKGRRQEYKTIQTLRRDGWHVIRSSRSLTPVDVVAAKNGQIKLIQVKSRTPTPNDREALKQWGEAFGTPTVEIWIWEKGARKPRVETLPPTTKQNEKIRRK